MRIAISIHIHVPKRAAADMQASAIGHPVNQPWRWTPHVIVPINPSPGHTNDAVVARVQRLTTTPFEIDAPEWIFEEERHKDAQSLVLEAVRHKVRQRAAEAV